MPTRPQYFNSSIKKILLLSIFSFSLLTPASWGEGPAKLKHRPIIKPCVKPAIEQIPTVQTFSDDEGEISDYFQNDWPMYNYSPLGTRYNTAETKLNPNTASGLKLKWTFITQGNVNATPVVFDQKIYAGDTSGNFYALNNKGKLLWQTKVKGSVTASALITKNRIIFGDLSGYIYSLNRQTGAIVWTIRPNSHPYAAVYGSPTLVGKQVVIGISSTEEFAKDNPNYPCCSFRGSVVRLNPNNGAVLWQTYTVTAKQVQKGASGAPVWSTPTYDATTGLIYVTTGNNYSQPTTTTSDAFVALNARTGAIVWNKQLIAKDAGDPDADFGDSPQIYRLQNGRKVVGAGQKSGIYYVLDAATGDLLNQYKALPLCNKLALGLFADSAVANGIVYANGTDCSFNGNLFALKGDGSGEIWHFTTPVSPALSGVAVANGVVYFQVPNAAGGFLYALDARNGKKLAQIPISAAVSGPAVVDGQLYLGTGITFPPLISTQGGSILGFGL